jgi:hypothetical protein
MTFKIFNNQILAALKCGSTYLAKVYPNDIKDVSYNSDDYLLLETTGVYDMKNISTIIIREPFEHLQSALHTEILMWYLLNKESLSIETATPLIKNFITTDTNTHGTTHWDVNYYEILYNFWKDNKNTIKVVHLSDLSAFLKENCNVDIPHDKFEYGILAHQGKFKYAFTTKQKLSNWIKESMPELWGELIKDMNKANKFYNLLINESQELI